MTQRARVARLLRQRGEEGITAADFLLPVIVDGGPPIARLAARIDELRSSGFAIVTEGKRSGFGIYVLREQCRATAEATVAHGPGDRLLATPPRCGVLGWEDDA